MACSFALFTTKSSSSQRTEELHASQTRLLFTISCYTAAITTVIGLCILLAWHSDSSWVNSNIPLIYQSKYNTALGLCVVGFGLLAAVSGRMRLVRAAGIFLLLLGTGTLLEYAVSVDLGIDQLLMVDNWNSGAPYPGRMSPNSAVCFVLLAVIFLMLHTWRSRRSNLVIMESIVCILLAVSLAALGGYFASAEVMYNWGTYAQMAPQTAIGFLSAGICLAMYLWSCEQSSILRLPVWIPTLLCFFILWFDLSTPLGVAAGIAYLPLIFCSLWFVNPRAPFVFASIASLLTVVAYFYSPRSDIPAWIPLTNRVLTIGALWTIAIGVYLGRRDSLARKQSESHLRSVVATVLDGLITIDEKGIVHTFNPAAVRIFGYDPEEVIGQNVKMLMPEPYYSGHDGYLRNYMTTGEAKVIGIGREVAAKRKNGSVFPMELGINEMQVSGIRMFVGTIRDISERKEAEWEIQQYVAALKRSNQELDDFAYIASHDLKEPLRGLSNNAEFLKEDYADKIDEDGAKRLGRMTYLCERMERLVNDLLYFSRLGRQNLAIQNTDLNEVIRDIESMMETTLNETKAKIIIHGTLPTIICDLPRMTEVFRNLITNAIKYNNKPEKRVEIGCETQEGERVFFVRDNGIGIPKEFYNDVFRIFKRLNDEDDSVKGTGVGLTFVKKIIERHNGRIWISSEMGKGTTFYFTIPEQRKGYL